ncbi:MAG: XRE family transcriptional regulator [Alistipes sp.]|nr:XRE family transcriptional regulator [Alistipes sp.]
MNTDKSHTLYNNSIQKLAENFPELNIKQVACALGINDKLMHQYSNGSKNPGFERRKEIERFIHDLGRELLKVEL